MIRCKYYYDYGRESSQFNRGILVLHVDASRIDDLTGYIRDYITKNIIGKKERTVWGYDSLIISDIVSDNKCTLPFLVDQLANVD